MFITLSTRVQIGRKINWPGASRPADRAVDSINRAESMGQEYIEQNLFSLDSIRYDNWFSKIIWLMAQRAWLEQVIALIETEFAYESI